MLHKVKPHVRKHSKKYIALTLVLTLSIVLFQYRPSQFETSQAAGLTQWADTLITDSTANSESESKIVRTSYGDYIIVWIDDRNNATTGSDIYAQKIKASDGSDQWTANGVIVTNHYDDQPAPTTYLTTTHNQFDVMADSSGGAIIVYTSEDGSGSTDVYAQRLDSSGNAQWNLQDLDASGTAGDGPGEIIGHNLSSDNTNFDYLPKIMSDDSGGAYVLWAACDDDAFCNGDSAELTRIDGSTGTVHTNWNPTEQQAGSYEHVNASYDYSLGYEVTNAKITPSGSSVIVVFHDYLNAMLVAQRIGQDGSFDSNWKGDNKGTPIIQPKILGTSVQNSFDAWDIASDSSGNLLLGHHYYNGSFDQALVQKNSYTDGSVIFGGQASPVVIRSAPGYYANVLHDGSGGMFFAFFDTAHPDGAGNIYVQNIDSSGSEVWTAGGVTVDTAGMLYTNSLSTDGSGGVVTTYYTYDSGWDVRAQRVLNTGSLDWSVDGLQLESISPQNSPPNTLMLAGDGSNGAVVTYGVNEDIESGSTNNIHAQYADTDDSTVTVVDVDPGSGDVAGGTSVSITGTNFANITDVTFGGTSCSGITVVDTTEITCTTPDHASGTVDVIVTSSTNGSGTLTNGFEYTEAGISCYTVADAGTTAVNGDYNEAGTHNEEPYYTYSAYYLFYGGSGHPSWIISDVLNASETPLYYNDGTDPTASYMTVGGTAPPPTVSECSGGGGCGELGPNQQCGILELNPGSLEIYYDNFGSGTLAGFDLTDASGDPLVSQSEKQDAFSLHSTQATPWGATDNKEAFIGIADMTGTDTAWYLTAQVAADMPGNTNSITLTDQTFQMATSGTVWGDTGPTLTDNEGTTIDFTQNDDPTEDSNDIYHSITSQSYTYTTGDITAPLNTALSLTDPATYVQGIRDSAVTVINKAGTLGYSTPGIFGIAANYYMDVNAGTPADTYTATITYTLMP